MKQIKEITVAAILSLGSALGCVDYREYQREVGGYKENWQKPGSFSILTHIADHTTGPVGFGVKWCGDKMFNSDNDSPELYHWGWKGPLKGIGAVLYGSGWVVQYLPQTMGNSFPLIGDSFHKLVSKKFLKNAPKTQYYKAVLEAIGFWIPVPNDLWMDEIKKKPEIKKAESLETRINLNKDTCNICESPHKDISPQVIDFLHYAENSQK